MEFWQNIVLKWKQIQQFCLWALSSDPSGLVESGLYYNTTANRAALRDDTKTQFLAHLEDTYKNAGVVKQPTITKGAGSITVGNDAIIRCYKTTDYSGIIQEVVNPIGGTFALTENTPLWLVYTYGVGYSVQTSITGPLSNAIPVYRFFNAFGVIHSSTQDEMGVGATEKILVKQTRTEYIKRVGDSGIELSTSALNVLISGGLAYNGPILETILPFNSATNNLYRVVYDDGVWSQTTLHALTNTHYNPSTGLATLNSNKYCWAYVWRSIGDDVEALFQLGEQEYATEAQAVADIGKMPANIYGLYATHCVLVGYVLIKQGVTTTQYFSAWGRPTVAGAPVYHNTLAGIDAGDPGTAYFGHVKLIDNTRMNAAGAANGYALLGADGKLPSGQLPSYVDDVLEYAAKASFPATGENGKIYVDLATNLTWRWSGTTYVEISPSLALGETSATAYRGDRGKTAYDHSQAAHAPANADNTQAALNAGASKTTPVDADTLVLLDSAASNAIKKLSWANVKSTLKAYFDGIYSTLTLGTTSTTAARGDQGKTAYDHSQLTASNPHGTTAAQIASTATGDVSATNVQAAIAELASEKLSTSTASTTYATIASVSGKVDQVAKGGALNYEGANTRNWRGLAKINGVSQYNDGTVKIAFASRFNRGEIYFSFLCTQFGLGNENFIALWEGYSFSEIKVVVTGYEAVIYYKDPIEYNNISVLSMSIASNNSATVSPYDYNSPTDPGPGAQPDYCRYSALKYVNGLTSDAQAQIDGKAPINATLTNESGQDVLPTGTYAITAILQRFRNNLSRLFTAVAGKAPTSHASTDATYGVADADHYAHAMASSANPLMNGTATAGTDNGKFAREGHVHPHDTSRLAIGDGLIAGASVVVRAYNSGNTYTSNVIYLEY